MSHTPPVCETDDEPFTPTPTPALCTSSTSTDAAQHSTAINTIIPGTLTPPETPITTTFPTTATIATLSPPSQQHQDHQQPDWTTLERQSAAIIPPPPLPADPSTPVQLHTWPSIRHAISINRPDLFKRSPLTRPIYKTWCRAVVSQYGSMTAYMLSERLHWTPTAYSADTGPVFNIADPGRVPFTDTRDYSCMFNDWPYGSLEAGVVHLVVWSKIRIPVERESGLPTAEARGNIERFVEETFVERWRRWDSEHQENNRPGVESQGPASPDAADPASVQGRHDVTHDSSTTAAAAADPISGPAENVSWFKNPPSLQTVAGLEHIHILLRHPPTALLYKWTGGETGPRKHPGYDC